MDRNPRRIIEGKNRRLGKMQKMHLSQKSTTRHVAESSLEDLAEPDSPDDLGGKLYSLWCELDDLSAGLRKYSSQADDDSQSFGYLVSLENTLYEMYSEEDSYVFHTTWIDEDYIEPAFDPDDVDDTKDPEKETDICGVEVYVNPLEKDLIKIRN